MTCLGDVVSLLDVLCASLVEGLAFDINLGEILIFT
jgi:hypothetical protein